MGEHVIFTLQFQTPFKDDIKKTKLAKLEQQISRKIISLLVMQHIAKGKDKGIRGFV